MRAGRVCGDKGLGDNAQPNRDSQMLDPEKKSCGFFLG